MPATSSCAARPTTSSPGLGGLVTSIRARFGVWRMDLRVEPGLYRIGDPTPQSRVFVSSNYSLSFDALRSCLGGPMSPCWILVLDSQGVNVWCAAGKGVFGTEEVVRSLRSSDLANVVAHREIVVPQLGATGVCAREVKEKTGFSVRWGPVRAKDLPDFFLSHGGVVPGGHAMRRVRFPLLDRAVLIPVELVSFFTVFAVAALVTGVLVGPLSLVAVVACYAVAFAGFPLALPMLPGGSFTAKGLWLGAASSLAQLAFGLSRQTSFIDRVVWFALLAVSPVLVAIAALLFSGSTTFSSKSAVVQETLAWLKVLAGKKVLERASKYYRADKTLAVKEDLCIGCGECTKVCPHDVLELVERPETKEKSSRRVVRIAAHDRCMECGACKLNCPYGAIEVESGVGCAWAIVASALTGQETVTCEM